MPESIEIEAGAPFPKRIAAVTWVYSSIKAVIKDCGKPVAPRAALIHPWRIEGKAARKSMKTNPASPHLRDKWRAAASNNITASQIERPAMKPNWSPEHHREATSPKVQEKAIDITLLSVLAKLMGRSASGGREQSFSSGSPEGLGMKTIVVELKWAGGEFPANKSRYEL
jgi:hypothetical protein